MITVTPEVETLLREDDYVNKETGLIFCKNCRTPRQIHLDINGEDRIIRTLCTCRKEKRDREEQAWKAMEVRDRITRNRSVGLADPVLREYTFANDMGYNPKQMAMAKQFVANWDTISKESAGLLLWGDIGTGKTFIAGCIANDLLNRGVPVMMTNFTRLLNRLTDIYSGDRNAYIDSLNAYPLLIIDDLGVERNSEFSREQVFNIIDSRYRSQLPMIITTNLTPEFMRNPPDLTQKRIYDRVLERCIPIRVNNQSIRKLNAEANMAKMKSLFQEVTV